MQTTEPNLTANPAVATTPDSKAKSIRFESLTIHPLAEKFPVMPEKDFADLKESIRKHGLFDPIVVNDQGQILDGRHRYKAIVELDSYHALHDMITFNHIKGSYELSEEQFIYDSNIHRRHLTDDQRAALATEFLPYFRKEAEKAKEEGNRSGGKSDLKSGPTKKRNIKSKKANSTVGKVAAKAGVSIHKAEQAIMVNENAPELSSAVASGEMPLKDAAKEVASSIEKKAKPKKIFNGGIKGQNTRNTPVDVPVEKAVRAMFDGFIETVMLQHPALPREEIIGILRDAINT